MNLLEFMLMNHIYVYNMNRTILGDSAYFFIWNIGKINSMYLHSAFPKQIRKTSYKIYAELVNDIKHYHTKKVK